MKPPERAFSLIEVVLALGICAFVLVALIGLFSTGLKAGRESEDQIQAANMASQILTKCLVSPSNSAIPFAALTNAYADAFTGPQYVGTNGQIVAAGQAAYRIACKAGTTPTSGTRFAQLYFVLTWPPQADPTNAAGKFETISYIPLR